MVQKWITIVLGLELVSELGTINIVSIFPSTPPERTTKKNLILLICLSIGEFLVYNFLQASTLYTLFVFLTLLIAQTLPLDTFSSTRTRPYPGVDGQQIAIIALSFLFFLFTCSLWVAHTRLIGLNMTTIEEISLNRIKRKERNALNGVYGFWNFR